MSDTGASAEMPRYRYKEVHALKIKSVNLLFKAGAIAMLDEGAGAIITPEDSGFAPFYVDHEYVSKHKPEAGGYYVVYADGYKSFSPAKAFEDGYTLIS